VCLSLYWLALFDAEELRKRRTSDPGKA